MSFQATGKVISIGTLECGVNQRTGGQWKRLQFAIECEDKERHRIPFVLLGMHAENAVFRHNDKVDVMFEINGREYDGRWYSQNEAWLVRPARSRENIEDTPSKLSV